MSDLQMEIAEAKRLGVYVQKKGPITHIQGVPVHKGTEWGHEDRGAFRGNRHELVFPNLIPKQERARIGTERALIALQNEVNDMQKFLFASGVDVNKKFDAFSISQGDPKAFSDFKMRRELAQKKAELEQLREFARDLENGWRGPGVD